MTRTRTVALLLLAGCQQKAPPPTPAPKPAPPTAQTSSFVSGPAAAVSSVAPKPAPAPAPAVPAADVTAATAAARKVLADIVSGKPDPAAVTPAFRKALAGGDDAKADWAAEQYLKGLAGGLTADAVNTTAAGPVVVGTTGPAGDGRRAAFRVVKAGDGWQVDWLHVGPGGTNPTTPEQFAATAFLDTALGGQFRLTEAALTSAGRAKVAPPLGNDPLGFSRGILTNSLKAFAAGATGYTLTVAGGRATGELTGPGDAKRPFTLTLAADGLLVDDFQPR